MEFAIQSIPFILATAGHVDHGKSALVRALTGIDPDRLPEEKARGITIELGFAELKLASPGHVVPPVDYRIGLVDVPGHEDYVRNMVAGVGSVDAALLVVAADDGWMPQTEEHFQILAYLGVSHAVIALTKIDLATDEHAVLSNIRKRISGTPFENAVIVPTSIATGRGIVELSAALADMFSHVIPQSDDGKPRLPIDRVFTVKGVGTVVTGTLVGGTLTKGQSVSVQPQGSIARLRAIQTHNQEVEVAHPGSRVALNLPGFIPLTAGAAQSAQALERGNVVTLAALGSPQTKVDVVLERSLRGTAGSGRAPAVLQDDTTVRLHHGSGSFVARVRLLDHPALAIGQRSLARLTLASPVLALACDRFIIRDASQRHTLAGGIVLDPDPPKRARGTPLKAHALLLHARSQAPKDVAIFVRSQLDRDGVVEREPLLVRSRFSAACIAEAVEGEVETGTALAVGTVIVQAAWWSELRRCSEAAIDAYHRAHPDHAQVPIGEFRSIIASLMTGQFQRPLAGAVAEAMAGHLVSHGFVRAAAGIRRMTHLLALPPRLQPFGVTLRKRLAERPFDPPSRKELCASDLAQQAMRFLIVAGEAVEVGPEIVLSADAYRRAVEVVREHLRSARPATVSELKTLLGSSRRVTVPLLEKFDRDGITRRQGDLRFLRA